MSGSDGSKLPQRNRYLQVFLVSTALGILTVLYRFSGDEMLLGAWISVAPPILLAVALIPTPPGR